jgi:hypothetical protein
MVHMAFANDNVMSDIMWSNCRGASANARAWVYFKTELQALQKPKQHKDGS